MKLKLAVCLYCLLVLLLCSNKSSAQQLEAKPLLHPLFTDHMVLQRDKELSIWGWTRPGAQVTVSLAGKSASVKATASGRWEAKLGPFPAGGPHTLQIDGDQSKVVSDLLIGDVWICSGQSNMEWQVRSSNNPDEEIAAANHPRIRLFTVPKKIARQPQELVEGVWTECNSESIPNFSAVGYFFGRQLHQALDVPIGLIHTSWGGTVAEAWTSTEALKSMPDFEASLVDFQRTTEKVESSAFNWEQSVSDWWKQNDVGSRDGNGWSHTALDHSNWKTMNLPANWESANVGLDEFDGLVWFRREFELPSDWHAKDVKLELGPIDDVDTTWVNGHEVGGMSSWDADRKYTIAAEYLHPGKNTIAIRVFDGNGGGGIYGEADQMVVRLADDASKTLPLAGDWAFKVSAPLKDLAPFPQQPGNNPNAVTVLYNGMLAPLVPYGIKGAIWYQGESNAGRPMQYRRLLPTMIQDWRNRFDQGDFPFFIVQLANFLEQQQDPVQTGSWAELREAQLLTAQQDDNVGLAITTDIGKANDIHPRNKQDVGKRLALSALKIAYKRDVVDSGPTLKTMEIVGDQLRVVFDNVADGLAVHGTKLQGFAIANSDSDEFLWADATLDGKDSILLSNEALLEPMKVRYNWANNPIGNLFNTEGLPAGPFRTDVPPTIEPNASSASIEIPQVEPESVGMSAAKLAKVKPVLQGFVDDHQVSGAIVIAARKGKVVLFESVGYGDIEARKPMEKDSILRFYSMTKAITSVSIMMLVEQGKIGLDDPVSKVIPEFVDLEVFTSKEGSELKVEPADRQCTIRDLLRHTSGLTYGFFGNTPVDAQYLSRNLMGGDLEQMVERLGEIPLLYQPGTRFNYSVSTDVLGHIIERVSGMPLDKYFEKHILAPLDMHDTAFHLPQTKAPRFVNNYGPKQDGAGLRVVDNAATSRYLNVPSMLSGGGGLVSTARDYLRFCQMLLNKGEFQGQRLLQSETVETMTRNQLPDQAYPINLGGQRDGVGFGLGFSVVVERTEYTKAAHVGEYGWGGAASTHFWISPKDDLAVVVLTQLRPFSFQLEDAVKPLIYDAVTE